MKTILLFLIVVNCAACSLYRQANRMHYVGIAKNLREEATANYKGVSDSVIQSENRHYIIQDGKVARAIKYRACRKDIYCYFNTTSGKVLRVEKVGKNRTKVKYKGFFISGTPSW
jgi:hypothetical protein